MKRFIKTMPPNPSDPQYVNNPLAWQRAMYDWASEVVGKLENVSKVNDAPMDQVFVTSSFSTNTSLSGTSSGTDVSNFLCSLVTALTQKGIIRSVGVSQ